MKFSKAGIFAAGLAGILPLLPGFGLINGATIPKAMLLLLASTFFVLVWGVLLLCRREVAIKAGWLSVSILGVLAAYLLASLLGVYPEHSLLGNSARATSFVFMTHIALLAITLGHLLRKDDWVLVRRAIIGSAGFFAALLILGTAGLGTKSQLLWFDLSTRGMTLGNESIVAMYLLLAAVLGAIEYVQTKDRRWKYGIAASIALIAASPVMINTGMFLGRVPLEKIIETPQIVLGMTRATSIVFAGLIGFVFVWWRVSKLRNAKARKTVKAILATVALLGAVGGSLLHLVPKGPLQERLADPTTMPRYIVWDLTYDAISQRPVTGWGPENYDRAFEANFRTELYQTGGRIEGWFDRAHNVFLDTAAGLGVIGLIAYGLLIAACVLVIMRARRGNSIGEAEQVLLLAFIVAHLLQLQTAFDTIPTFGMLAFIGGYLVFLESDRTRDLSIREGKNLGFVLIAMAGLSIAYFALYEFPRQVGITTSLRETHIEARTTAIDLSLSRESDFEGLHTGASHFVDGALQYMRSEDRTQKETEQVRSYLDQYLRAYAHYLETEPDHYRARMHYAYLLLLDTEWGGDRAQDAATIVQSSYDLSPGNPVTYVLDAVSRAYANDYAGAETVLEKLRAILPEAQLTKDSESWLAKQKKIAPQHSFLIIGNL